MSEVFDFCGRFTADYLAWCQKHPAVAADEEKLEAIFPRQYEKWYASPKTWLNNKSPNQYFEEIKDAQIYASMFVSYLEQDIELPDPLIDCMLQYREDLYPILRNILLIDGTTDMAPQDLADVRAHIIPLITEMDKPHPYDRYIELLRDAEESDSLTQEICTILEEPDAPDDIRAKLLTAFVSARLAGKEGILDLLCGYPDEDDAVYTLLDEEFRRGELETAFLSGLAGKLGDERLLPRLEDALKNDAGDYFTHSAIKFAIEEISGEILPDKDFTGDPDYDARRL